MAETEGRQAGAVERMDGALNEDAELAQEFRQVLRDLAGELASVATQPSVSGLLLEVRSNLDALVGQVKEEVGGELAALREERGRLLSTLQQQAEKLQQDNARQLGEGLESGLTGAAKVLEATIDEDLRPMVEKVNSLNSLEATLRGEAGKAREAVGDAVKQVRGELQDFARDSEAIKLALTGTAEQFSKHADNLRRAVDGTIPTLDAACRNLQASQESLKGMIRGYNETLEKSIAALETKFAGILAASLERVNQRQTELETRIRSTSDRTEEAVVDLMQGNQSHHQAMVDSTAASLSQLEFFAKSLRRMHSGLSSLLILAATAVIGLGFVAYTLMSGR